MKVRTAMRTKAPYDRSAAMRTLWREKRPLMLAAVRKAAVLGGEASVERLKQAWDDPEQRAAMTAAGRRGSAVARSARPLSKFTSESARLQWQNPAYREKVRAAVVRSNGARKGKSLAQLAARRNPAAAAKGERMRRLWQDPVTRPKMLAGVRLGIAIAATEPKKARTRPVTEAMRARMARSAKRRWKRPEEAAVLLEVLVKARATPPTIKGQCTWCGEPAATTLDHVIPRGHPGWTGLDNKVPACSRCNSSRGNRTPEAWLAAGLYATLTEQEKESA